MYKEASKQKLRFQTNKGTLSTEQLWDLSLTELDDLAVNLEKDYKESGKKSFLIKKSSKDKTSKLRFDVVMDILTEKVEESELQKTAKSVKEHNEKILSLIADKQDENLKSLSLDELKKQLQ